MATYLFDNSKNLVDINSSGDKYGFDNVKNKVLFNNQEGVYGIDEYKNRVEIEVELPVTVPMVLSDGSVLFYDRGEQYGEYKVINGNIIRISEGIDDGSATNNYWRYLICDKSDLEQNRRYRWGVFGTFEDVTDVTIGTGLPNTNVMIANYNTTDGYPWKLIIEKRDTTGYNWFLPSEDELHMVYNNWDIIINSGADDFRYFYWSSSEYDADNAWYQFFTKNPAGDGKAYQSKNRSSEYRLLRRV